MPLGGTTLHLASGGIDVPKTRLRWPSPPNSAPTLGAADARNVTSHLQGFSLEQKVGQVVQAEIASVTPDEAGAFGLGSILNGGGSFPGANKHASVGDWIDLADAYHAASTGAEGTGVPILWGTDAVHGHSNVHRATVFPHNIGLGAARDPDLVAAIGAATAVEVAATGIDWTFAPTLAVPRDNRWGRTYEGYAEHPDVVAEYASRMVAALQGVPGTDGFLGPGRVVATAKHFIGEGATEGGRDQGDSACSEETLYKVHSPGHRAALAAGVQTVMAAYNSWCGEKVHGHHYLLTQVLKGTLGFDGFVVSDWNGYLQVADDHAEACARTVNAGVDMLMVGDDWQRTYHSLLQQVREGLVSEARIDDAVARILRVKARAGLFRKGPPSSRPATDDATVVGCTEHRALARRAVQRSLVLLKNDGVLPLARDLRVLVAGDGAHNIGKQCGGWTLTWQGTDNDNADFPNATSIHDGIEAAVANAGSAVLSPDGQFTGAKPDAAIVVFGEDPYAEGDGDRAHLSHTRANGKPLAILRRLKALGIPTVSVFLTGRPMWINPELNASDAFVVAWLPGSEGAGVADVLFRNAGGDVGHDFEGRLSFSWPKDALQASVNVGDADYAPLFPYGFGLSYAGQAAPFDRLDEVDTARDVPEDEMPRRTNPTYPR